MSWIQKNFKTFIYIAFLVPILTVAFVSISHVATWYGLSNPVSWALYLSFGIEIAALSALAAISARMGSKVYFPFIIVTLIQFIGNIFFAYQYINTDSQSFKDWVDLVDPLVSFIGVESGDYIGHKRFLALFAGGMLPIISLSFLHMLVKFEEEDRSKKNEVVEDKLVQEEPVFVKPNSDEVKFTPTEEDLRQIEEVLRKINEEKFKSLEVDNTNQVPNELNDEVKEVVEELPIEEEIQETKEESNDIVIVEEQEPTIIEEVVKEEEIKTEEVVLENSEPIIEEVTELPKEEPVVTPEQRAINRLSYTKRNANNVSVQRI
jgi:hypothetical protein